MPWSQSVVRHLRRFSTLPSLEPRALSLFARGRPIYTDAHALPELLNRPREATVAGCHSSAFLRPSRSPCPFSSAPNCSCQSHSGIGAGSTLIGADGALVRRNAFQEFSVHTCEVCPLRFRDEVRRLIARADRHCNGFTGRPVQNHGGARGLR